MRRCRESSATILVLTVMVLAMTAGLAPGALSQEAGASAEQASSGPRPLSAWDTLRIASVGSPTLSPDGAWVLYARTERDLDSEQLDSRTHLWRVAIDGTGTRQLTRGEESATSPAWFPGGDRIAFLRNRGERRQIWAMHVDGGEAWPVTDHPEGVSSFELSPDGTQVFFTAVDAESDADKERARLRDDAEVVDAEFRFTHLWVQPVAGGEARRLTEGEFTVSDPQVSPDGARVAFVARPNTRIDDSWNSDVWLVDAASGERRRLLENPGPDASPRWSPDGSTIAVSAHPHVSTTTWYSKLHLIPVDGGETRILLREFDRDFGTPIWSPGGDDLFWVTGDRTRTNLFAVQLATDEVRDLDAPAGANSQFDLSADGSRWAWVHTAPGRPGEIVTAPVGDLSAARPLTDANPWLQQEQVQLARVETIRWTNGDGQEIEGVVHFPIGFQEGRRYPLVVNPHGGPSGARLTAFSTAHQLMAGNGFLVLEPNFRGSSNYGQEFLNANRDYWGIRDYDDIMTGVDDVIARGWADPDRMVAHGWSYGGYMTFWMSTQTDRFKVISPGAGLSNLYSMYSTTDIPNYLGWFFGTPWDNEEIYRRLSPIRHVKNVTADVLIMHGANDARVPPEQAVEFYRAMRDLGKKVTYVSYPRQGHGIVEPRLQVDRLRRYLFTFAEAVGVEVVSEKPEDNPWTRDERAKAAAAATAGVVVPDVMPSAAEPDPLLDDAGIFAVSAAEERR